MEIITRSAEETKRFGKKFADSLKGGEVVALKGELGSGKTTFVQGLAEGLVIKQRVISPTFILVRKYPASSFNFYHIDLYRIESDLENEIKNLGLNDIWGKEENIVVIEWAEKIKDLLPKSTKWINFQTLNDDERKITWE